MKNGLQIIGVAIGISLIVAFGSWWEIYKYHDCKKVGHSGLYCVVKIGN